MVLYDRFNIPVMSDLLVKTEYDVHYIQMDHVTLHTATINHKPVLFPINWELDDPTHDKLMRSKKDKARDAILRDIRNWHIVKPYNSGWKLCQPCQPKEYRPSWIIARIPYKVIEGLVRTKGGKKYKMYSLKTEIPGYEERLAKFESFINKVISSTQPGLIRWED